MLSFDEDKHEYRADGRVIPGVTSILQPLLDYSMIPHETLGRAQMLGQAVHRATELFDNDDLDMDSLSAELVPYLAAWQKFRAECDFHPMGVEQRVHHHVLDYAGTYDRVGLVRGEKAVIDIKKMMTLGPVIGLQLAAYKEAANLSLPAGERITRRYALGLRPDGTYRMQPYNDPHDFAVFASLLTVRNWRKKHGV